MTPGKRTRSSIPSDPASAWSRERSEPSPMITRWAVGSAAAARAKARNRASSAFTGSKRATVPRTRASELRPRARRASPRGREEAAMRAASMPLTMTWLEDGGATALDRKIGAAEPRAVVRVVDAMEGVHGGHAGNARGEEAVHSRALAVGVHEIDAVSPDEAEHVEEGSPGEPIRADAHEAGAALREDTAVGAPRW